MGMGLRGLRYEKLKKRERKERAGGKDRLW